MRNKIVLPALLVAFALLIHSCKNTNSPQAVTEKFLNSFVKMDYATAKSLSTKNTWEFLDIWVSYAKYVPEDVRNEKAAAVKVKVTDMKKESDSTVLVTYTSEPKVLPFNKLRLLQQKDAEGRVRWKVDISTLDLVGGDELYIQEEHRAVEDTAPAEQPADTLPKGRK